MAVTEFRDHLLRIARDEPILIHCEAAESIADCVLNLADENDRLRDDLTVADDALKLAREAHQVTIDAENRLRAVKCESCTDATPRLCLSCADFDARTLRAQLAEAVALLEKPCGNTYSTSWNRDRIAFTAKLRGTL